ncbi:hypothetical protein GCM10010275_36820 [Streptomyces litmocidini]|nr:hypothetical protein GCM10010275_36820 [Streptomyces litmocidini]
MPCERRGNPDLVARACQDVDRRDTTDVTRPPGSALASTQRTVGRALTQTGVSVEHGTVPLQSSWIFHGARIQRLPRDRHCQRRLRSERDNTENAPLWGGQAR